jgi:hypothetical protein
MKINITCFLLIYSILFFSCGQSALEKSVIQQKHDDSFKSVIINEVMIKVKEREDSITLNKEKEVLIRNAQKKQEDSIKNFSETNSLKKESLVNMQNKYNNLQEILIEDDSKLAVLIDRQKNDAQFHMGRLPGVKEQTLKNDQLQIDYLRIKMVDTKNQMGNLNTNLKNLNTLIQ